MLHTNNKPFAAFACLVTFLAFAQVVFAQAQAASAYETTEQREPCAKHNPERNAYFGDLHIHTRYSLDAATQDTRTSPADAYRFAKGERIPVQPYNEAGEGMRSLQLERPLDFAGVTDHAELFGELNICRTPGLEGYNSWECKIFRNWNRGAFFLFNTSASLFKTHLGLCGEDGIRCERETRNVWKTMQEQAEAAYDRTEECSFTSFIGYEWTGSGTAAANLHRNVIFRNRNVPEKPFTFIDGPAAPTLWDALDEQCVDAGIGCEVVVIPHNSNISNGLMFQLNNLDGSPLNSAEAKQRARLERLVEVMQHKGSSECYFGLGSEDELCDFEQLPYDTFGGQMNPLLRKLPSPNDGFLRGVLSDGLSQEGDIGVNPFKWGFIGSTDTHIAAAGGVQEQGFLGHGGAGKPAKKGELPKGLPDNLEFNPGGLAVLWAEENSRDALFAAMQRREAYGTSGPRIELRVFAGEGIPADICASPNFAKIGYELGVPMGGDLQGATAGAPRFAITALKDAGVSGKNGMDLERVQIIKGWLAADGSKQEKVYDVANYTEQNSQNGGAQAGVDPLSCKVYGEGFKSLCNTWQDPEFNPKQAAWYYVRVVENPSCRWSQHLCVAANVNCEVPSSITDGFEACCSAEHKPVIQERAWSAPIWYTP